MGPSFYFQLAVHVLCELAAALVIAFWVAQGWTQSPALFPVNLVRSPSRSWLMVAFGIAPALLALLLNPLFRQFYASGGSPSALIPISYVLSVIYGGLVGLASSCCVAPADSQREFRPGISAAVSAVMVLAYYLLSLSLLRQFFVHELAKMVATLAILFIARSIVATNAPLQVEPNAVPLPPVQRKLWPAIVIGFLPSALFLITFAVAVNMNLEKDTSNALLWLASGVSVVCCFTASILLFKRSTAGAITGGILFLLLNAFIGFFFGCCASFNGGSFH